MITLPGSEFFNLQSIGKGVFAAIARDGSPAFSNAGVVDTSDHILIFDTFNTFRAALDLRRHVDLITKRDPNFVIISHPHPDHWMGNQVFADDTTILASRYTIDAMIKWAAYFRDYKKNREKVKANIQEIERRLAKTNDPRLKTHLSWSLTIEQHEYHNLADTIPHFPNQSFDSKLDIYGTDALVKIISLGVGHSTSDTIMVLPEDKIAFIGDLGFFKTHPYLIGSNPDKWVAILDELLASKLNIFVPGHGSVGTKADLQALKAYILALQANIAAVVNIGGSEDDAANQPIPDYAVNWAGLGRYERSMRYLYQWQTNKDLALDSQVELSRSLVQEVEAAGYILEGVEFSVSKTNPSYVPPDEK